MSRQISGTLAVILLCAGGADSLVHRARESKAEYKSRDGSRVVIVTVKKAIEGAGNESVLEFYSPENQRLCALDYSSDDGEHGFAVAKGAWTPDENFFVFSLVSSGGHQPWHAPTAFYSAKSAEIFSLDGYLEGAGIAKTDFDLKAPNTVVTEVWKDKPVPVTVSLAEFASSPRSNSRPLKCAGGKTLKREFRVLA